MAGFITGLFNICDIAPISSNAEFRIKSVSASKVIIYFIFGILSKYSNVFSLKGFFIFPNKYSFNCESIPLFLSQPRYEFSPSFQIRFLYIKLKIFSLYFLFNSSTNFLPSCITSSSKSSSLLSLSEQSPSKVKYKFLLLFAK